MLQKLNERIQGVFAWIIISLIAITFAVFGVDYYMQSRAASVAKAEVNGEMISNHEFELNYRRAQAMQDSSGMTAAADVQRKKTILDDLIRRSLALQSAISNGFLVSAAQVSASIETIPAFQEDGKFSVRRFQQILNNAMFTPESFHQQFQKDLILNQQQAAVTNTEFSLANEVKHYIQLALQTRNYQYVVLPLQAFMSRVTIPEGAVEAYYQANKKQFITPEQVSVDYVRLSMQEIRNKVVISDEQLQNYYEENKANYRTPAQWQVAHLLISVPQTATTAEQEALKREANEIAKQLQKDPTQFEHLVKTRSDDKISVLNSGVLPWITAGKPEYDKALLNLTQVGQISSPVLMQQGYEIFKLLAYKPAALRSFEASKKSIEHQLKMDLVQTEFSKAAEQLSDLSYQTPDSLSQVAETLHLTIEQTKPFTKDGGYDEFTKNPGIIKAAYSNDVLEQGNNSEPVQLNNDTIVVLRLAKHFPPKQQSFAEVKPIIQANLQRQQAQEKAQELGNKIINAKPAQRLGLLAELHLQWQIINQATRKRTTAPEAINQLAFDTPEVGMVSGRSLTNGDFALVNVTAIEKGLLSASDKQAFVDLSKQFESRYGKLEYNLFITHLVSKAKIVYF